MKLTFISAAQEVTGSCFLVEANGARALVDCGKFQGGSRSSRTIGYQAAGTLGRKLVDGEKLVRIFGEKHAVQAAIHTIGGLSAHADQTARMGWLKGFSNPPARTFVVHGEARTACGFADLVADELGWSVEAPAPGTRVDL